jgi:SAM-dependent methyltransferase
LIMANERAKSAADWDKRYVDNELPWDSGKPDVHLRRFIESLRITPCEVLEIGCGTGTNAIWLAGLGFDVVGLDLSPTAIKIAETKASEAKASCRWLAANFMKDPVPGSPFGLVFDRGCFHVLDEAQERAIYARRVAELLEEEWSWLSIIGSTDGPPRDTGPPRRSAAEIVAAVEPHLEILDLKSTIFDEEDHADKRAWLLHARRRAE